MNSLSQLVSRIVTAIVLSSVGFTLQANSRLLATGGATQIEGQAGGGIVPWAVLTAYGSTGEMGMSAFATHLELSDYSLNAYGVSASFHNRVEVSYARQSFDLGTLGDSLSLANRKFRQDIFAAKVRIAGDLIYEKMPQVALGLQYKHQLDFAVPRALGVKDDSDVEVYLSATKLWLAGIFDRNFFANATVRMTRANQGGLIGFGGDDNNSYKPVLEMSAGVFISRYIAAGFEYRQHSDNLSFTEQDDWYDAFIAFFPNKHISLVFSYANLGTIATLEKQNGWYLSLEVAY